MKKLKLSTILLMLGIWSYSQTITLSTDVRNAIFGSEQTNFKTSADLQLGVEWREKNVSFGIQIESFETIGYRDVFMQVGTYTNWKYSAFANVGVGAVIRKGERYFNHSFLTYDINVGLRKNFKSIEIGVISNYNPRPDINKPIISNYISIAFA